MAQPPPPSGQPGQGLEDRFGNMTIASQGPSTAGPQQQGVIAETQVVVDASGQKRQKRLNQSQRRELAAQLTIPIDPRPLVPPPPVFQPQILPQPVSRHQNQHQHQHQPQHQHQWQNSQHYQNQQPFNQQQRGGHGHQSRGSGGRGGGHWQGQRANHRPQGNGRGVLQEEAPAYRPHLATFLPPNQRQGGGSGGGQPHGWPQAQGPEGNDGVLQGEAPAYRSHSATFLPPDPGQGGVPFTQTRHQVSRSYQGPKQMNPPAEQYPMDVITPALPSPVRPDLQSPRFRNQPPHPHRHQTVGSGSAFSITREVLAQAQHLENICNEVVANAEINPAEIQEKEAFRVRIEQVVRDVITNFENEKAGEPWFPRESVQLKCFGSLMSGFATKDADMDLGLFAPLLDPQPEASGSPIPRLIEKAFLDMGLGARLLTRTRVPIIKICEKPPEELRVALLKEREDWEKGTVEAEVDVEDTHDEVEPIRGAEEAQPPPAPGSESQQPARVVEESEAVSTPKQLLESLKQDGRSLTNYHNAAKKVLRKLGGYDITHTNVSSMTPEWIEPLNRVCLAFARGVANEKVREALLNSRNLNEHELLTLKLPRTLLGVLFQIEGEILAQSWEDRPVQEKDDNLERRSFATLARWRDLMHRSNVGQDPLTYQKEVQNYVETLKRIPSLALLHLAQMPHEPVVAFHKRANQLLVELGGCDESSTGDTILPIVIRHYINGIWNSEVREQVDEFSKFPYASTLGAVAKRHKSLQLALDYERCLQKGQYQEPAASLVRCYVALLRGPMTKNDKTGELAVPLPDESDELMATIKQLGDPAIEPPNQPRDLHRDRLEFPKSNIGVQCDINFSAHLAVENTTLLRCYSLCDPRVRPLILFVKHWAKVRQINSPYRGTLGSYGYAIMMLHYLINVARPFVVPNLQLLGPSGQPPQMCKGYPIHFWRDEAQIERLAKGNELTMNRESLGMLLRGFFEYYAHNNHRTGKGFDWGRDVICLRRQGGFMSKVEKGWTGAKTVVESPAGGVLSPGGGGSGVGTPGGGGGGEVKEVRLRFLFAVEDPFETDHNVARTVTHQGIVKIRDEFRRAWGIIRGKEEGELLEDVGEVERKRARKEFEGLLGELHGGLL
ncbi:hypothetical protein QC761_304600 [Podospora bellae-mahoneyi]|uniref:polynucleotide adenylyltransferase n=1 Tax=Podospora bellae-mahoneyi TaxID=2093777 RepID=A0ABR0FM73_9PEZI|nr:hypothetical protein QC761_304600 [Podospora bellae-mahoneyi]